MTEEIRRVYIGGLFEGAKAEDLKDRFNSFGTVSDIEIKTKNGAAGQVFSTFGYLNLLSSENSFKKCVQLLNKSKWKGSVLQVQQAKQSFLEKLHDERASSTKDSPSSQSARNKSNARESKLSANSQNNNSNLEKSKASDVLHIRSKDKRKVLQLDPAKSGKKKRFDDSDEDAPVEKLTWNLPETKATPNQKQAQRHTEGMNASKVKREQIHVESGKVGNRMNDRTSDASDSEEDVTKQSQPPTNRSTVVAKKSGPVANDADFEVVAARVGLGNAKSSDKSRKRTRFDSSSGSDGEGQSGVASNTENVTSSSKKRKRQKKRKQESTESETKSGAKLTNHMQSSDSETDVRTKINKSQVKKLPVKSETHSDSESDVPDVETWIHQSKQEGKKNVSNDKPTKRDSKDSKKHPGEQTALLKGRAKSKNVNQVLLDEFSSGVIEPQNTTSQRSKMAPNDRADDTDDEDLLDVVARNDWSLRHLEKLAAKGKEPKSSAKDATVLEKPRTEAEEVDNDDVTAKKKKKEKSKGAEKKVNWAEKRKEEGNRKRLATMAEKLVASQRQSSAISAALAVVDKGGLGKKVVFDSSDEEEKEETPMETETPAKQTQPNETNKQTRLTLFEEEEEEKEESEEGKGGSGEDEFAVKKQFEGSSGAQLFNLQTRIGTTDSRFKLDSRFAEDEQDENEAASGTEEDEEEQVSEGEKEKRNTMSILEDVVEHSLNKENPQPKFKDMSSLRYDPTREDHKQFVRPEVADRQESKREKTKEVKPSDDAVPDVSGEKFFTVSGQLTETFREKQEVAKKGAFFSLLSMFGEEGEDRGRKGEEEKAPVQSASGARRAAVFPWQQEYEELSEYETHRVDQAKAVKINSAVDKQAALFSSVTESFFISANDPRLTGTAEGAEFSSQSSQAAQFQAQWQDKRRELIECYRSVKKKTRRGTNKYVKDKRSFKKGFKKGKHGPKAKRFKFPRRN